MSDVTGQLNGHEARMLPSGTVTFTFTDIEGSTRLLRRLGDVYADVLHQHRSLLRDAWSGFGGVEVDTEGDGCFVAFPAAGDAVAACVAAERALAGATWPPESAPKVRFGLHTGIAFPHGGDYIALAVHQAARVMSAAHGGQILLSEHTAAAAVPDMPGGIELANLGRYRLRDFETPVGLLQARGPDRRDAFPAVRAVPADRHNIVRPPTMFVGRRQELAVVEAAVAAGRVVSIVGVGGIGKTRLATELGLRLVDGWPDGVWMVDLSSVVDGSLVRSAVADALGLVVRDSGRRGDVTDELASRRVLLVLDNCEQVVDGCAALVSDVLARCPDVGVLATSREPLGLAGEVVHRLGPLSVTGDAVELFAARAADVAPDRTADRDPELVARICRRLDGLPLAIELAASRCNVLSAQEIYDGLDHRFQLLRSRNRTAPERQRTMTNLLDWSYELLDVSERTAFERLAVFAGTFGLDAASVIGHSGLDRSEVPELIWSLADKSLVVVEPAANATRYRMLETVRAYAAERWTASGDRASTVAALADWYLERFPLGDRGKPEWLSAMALELDTVGALLEAPEVPPAIVHALARIWAEPHIVAGDLLVTIGQIEHILQTVPTPTPERARLMFLTANLMGNVGRLAEAMQRCDEGDAMLAKVGETDRWGSVRLASARAVLLLRSGDPADAAAAEVRARADADMATRPSERADALLQLAIVLESNGGTDAADVYGEAVRLGREIGDHVLVMIALNNLVEVDLRNDALAPAARHQREALGYAAELGMYHLVSFGLVASARIAEALRDDAVAVRLHAFAETRLDEVNLKMFPDDQALSDEMLARCAARLGSECYAAERAAATGLTVEEALATADAVLSRAGS